MFIELYDNLFLNDEERDYIYRLISREIFAMTLTIDLLKNKIINLETIGDGCNTDSVMLEAQRGKNSVQLVSIVTKCYEEVCIQDSTILQDGTSRAAMSKYEKPSDIVYTIDKPSSSIVPRTYCFDTMDLIASVSEEYPINPKTNEPFSEFSLNMIRQRFHKEIAMYRRYKQMR